MNLVYRMGEFKSSDRLKGYQLPELVFFYHCDLITILSGTRQFSVGPIKHRNMWTSLGLRYMFI